MNKKGFTLIELLATIAVLSIIALIATPTVYKAITNSRNKAYNDQVSAIITGAKAWSTDQKNFYKLPGKSEMISVTLKELKTGGYVDSKIVNIKNGKDFDDNCTKVDITYDGKKLDYQLNLSSCTN